MKRIGNIVCKSVLIALLTALPLVGQVAVKDQAEGDAKRPLPDWYPSVASDILKWCKPKAGVWVDLGAGTGGVALAVASSKDQAASNSTIVLLDPDAKAMSQALRKGREKGLGSRLVAVVGVAEKMPLPDSSVDLVFSRGSIWFWKDRVQGIRETYRVLRPGGSAMIGGGLGSEYPEWARREFMRRRDGHRETDSPQAKESARLRDPNTVRQWAKDAGIPDFEVIGHGVVPADDPRTGSGIWLKFTKPNDK
jgi:SAM-dependent methyltransferase